MSDPRFQPRLMAAPSDRRHFGKVGEISWLEGSTELEVKRIATARLQHALAQKITTRLRDRGQTVRDYAELAAVSYDRMAKVLRGEALMRLEDVADAERLLGLVVHPLLEDTASAEAASVVRRVLQRRQHLQKMMAELAAENEFLLKWADADTDSQTTDP